MAGLLLLPLQRKRVWQKRVVLTLVAERSTRILQAQRIALRGGRVRPWLGGRKLANPLLLQTVQGPDEGNPFDPVESLYTVPWVLGYGRASVSCKAERRFELTAFCR